MADQALSPPPFLQNLLVDQCYEGYEAEEAVKLIKAMKSMKKLKKLLPGQRAIKE